MSKSVFVQPRGGAKGETREIPQLTFLQDCTVVEHVSVSLAIIRANEKTDDDEKANNVLVYSGTVTLDGGRGVRGVEEFRRRLAPGRGGVHAIVEPLPPAAAAAMEAAGHVGPGLVTHRAAGVWLSEDGRGPQVPIRCKRQEEARALEVYAICKAALNPVKVLATSLVPREAPEPSKNQMTDDILSALARSVDGSGSQAGPQGPNVLGEILGIMA